MEENSRKKEKGRKKNQKCMRKGKKRERKLGGKRKSRMKFEKIGSNPVSEVRIKIESKTHGDYI